MTRSESGAAASGAAEPRSAAIEFALFATGAPFSCEVLRALRERGCRPRRIVVPSFPPAALDDTRVDLLTAAAPDEFSALAGDSDFDHAPPALEANCAARLRAARIDFILVACWPYLLGPQTIAAARKAALNLHPSLLPRFRGPDPLGEQLAAGDPEFGVTLHLLDADFDHGDIVAQAPIEAAARRTTLERRCAARGAELFVAAATSFDDGWSLRRQYA